MGLLLRLGPNVIIDGIFNSFGSSYYTCAFYTLGITEGNSVELNPRRNRLDINSTKC